MPRLATRAAGSVRGFGFAGISVLPPTITSHPQSQSVAEGNLAVFTVAVTGTPPFTYQWRLNGTNISGATSSSYSFSTQSYQNGYQYSVVVTNALGSVTSNTAYLTVTPPVLNMGWNYVEPTKTYLVPSCSNVRIVFIGAGYNPGGTGSSSGGGGGGCFDVNLTVGSGINVGERLEFTMALVNWYDQVLSYLVRRPDRETGYIAKLTGAQWNGGNVSSDYGPGGGYSITARSGGNGGGAYVAYGSYAIAGGGGGGAIPSANGNSGSTPTGGTGGGDWMGSVGNGGDGAPYANWEQVVNGNPGLSYGGGGGGQTWGGYSGGGSGFYGVLCT